MELNYYRRLRELREDHDYSQADIGKRLGMSKQQYFLYEKGNRDIPTPVLIALADLYGTSVDYLVGRTDNPSPPQR